MSEANAPTPPAAPAPVLYDCDAEQRMPFQTERRGRLYNVAHVFGPVKDEAVLAFEVRRNQRISDAEANEADDPEARAMSGSAFEAALKFWEENGARAEGYAGEVSAKDKAFAVQSLLFAVEFEKLPDAADGELCPADDDSSTHRLRCLFDGKLVVTEHTLRAASTEEIADFQALMSRTLLVQGTQFGQTDFRVPSRARALGQLYDRVKVEARGYAGRVPLYHKMAVALRHFRAEQKALVGNATASSR